MAKEILLVDVDPKLPKASSLLVLFVLVGLAAWGGITLTRETGRIATIWPANAIVLAVLLDSRRRQWPAYLVCGYFANVLANRLTGDQLPVALGFALCNTLEILTAAWAIFKYTAGVFDLRRRKALFNFVLFAVAVAPAGSATLAASWAWVLSPHASWTGILRSWYLADALGMATITPCLWALHRGNLTENFKHKKAVGSVGVLLLLGLVTFVAFVLDSYLLWLLVFPCLMLVVFRMGFAGTAVGTFLVTGVAIGVTVQKFGSMMFIADAPLAQRILVLQLYVTILLVTTLPFAVLLDERKELQRATRSSGTLYRVLFERVGEAVLLYPILESGRAGRIEKANERACNYLGYSAEELERITPYELDAPENEPLPESVITNLRTGKPAYFERVHMTKDGRRIPVEVGVHWIEIDSRTYAIGILRDLSERQQMENALRASEQRFRGLVESFLQVGVLQLGPKAEIVYANQAALGMFGESLESTIGKNSAQLGWVAVREDGKEMPFEQRPSSRAITTGQPVRYEVIGWRAPKREGVIWTLCEVVPFFDKEGKLEGLIAALTNISELKATENMLRAKGEELRSLTVRLQEVREEERTLVARELHDQIGQAFTALKMDIRWLAKRLPTNDTDVRGRVDRAFSVVSEGAEWVRAICTELRPGVLDDLGLAAAIEWQAKEFSMRTGIPCKVTLPANDPDLDGNRSTAIFRIFQEALTNVVRHAEARSVRASLKERDGNLVLLVRDDGRGIRQADLKNSLGLLGMKERAQSCGGEVSISGKPGIGTKVSVKIPLH